MWSRALSDGQRPTRTRWVASLFLAALTYHIIHIAAAIAVTVITIPSSAILTVWGSSRSHLRWQPWCPQT